MKMLLGLGLLSLLISPVLSIDCYVCRASPTNDICNSNNNTQRCQPPLDTCMTAVSTLGSMKAIVKSCSSQDVCNGAVAASTVDVNGNGDIVNCCNSFNLCNFSGAESVRIHTALLLLTVGALFLLSH